MLCTWLKKISVLITCVDKREDVKDVEDAHVVAIKSNQSNHFTSRSVIQSKTSDEAAANVKLHPNIRIKKNWG